MLRHFDQDERQTDGSRNWDLIKSVLMRKFAHEGGRDFSFQRRSVVTNDFLKAAQRRELNTATDEDGNRCSSRAIYSRTLWWHSNRARIDELCICVGNSRVKDVSAGVLIHANVNVTKLLSLWWSKPKQSQRRRSPSCVQKSIGTWLCHWSDDIGAQNSTFVDVPHRDAGKKRRGSTGFVLGKLVGTTSSNNGNIRSQPDSVQPGRTSIHTRCFHSGGATNHNHEE